MMCTGRMRFCWVCLLKPSQHHVLCFSHRPWMRKKLEEGTTLVVDRYAFSGAAFTSAKPVSRPRLFSRQPSAVRRRFRCSVSTGLLSGLVQAARRGAAEAGPGDVPAAQPRRRRPQRPVRGGAVRDQRVPESRSAEVRTADGGSVGQLAGESPVGCTPSAAQTDT